MKRILHLAMLRLMLWDCEFAIQRCSTAIARQREELREREDRKHELQMLVLEYEQT